MYYSHSEIIFHSEIVLPRLRRLRPHLSLSALLGMDKFIEYKQSVHNYLVNMDLR